MKNLSLVLATVLIFGGSTISLAQTNEMLKSQLDYCKKESIKLEGTIETYKKLLEIQGADIQELKAVQQNQETQIKNLKAENDRLNSVALELLQLATDYEIKGNFAEAIEIYKLLITSYPSSMEAISAKLKVLDVRKKQQASAMQKN
jgi:tetratricopeptide (TPR) repeat protein